jgi:hypothetical protein
VPGSVFFTKFPSISVSSGAYDDSVKVTLKFDSGETIHYTTDNTTPTITSPTYSSPLTIKTSCTLKASGFIGAQGGPMDSANFAILHPITKPASSGLRYRYYEYTGAFWDSLSKHDLTRLTPVRSGVVDSFCLGMQNRSSRFAVRFDGAISIATAGVYTFWTYSDAGSKLYIDGNCVANNDGRHNLAIFGTGAVPLTKAVYRISLDYFEDTLSSGLIVYYQGPGMATRIRMPKAILFNDPNTASVAKPFGAPLSCANAGIKISRLSGGAISVSVPNAGPHELRIARADGKIVTAIRSSNAKVYYFTRQELVPGLYFVSVLCGKQSTAKFLLQ